MVWLKSCQRCGGDLYMEKDEFGPYVGCFQCGASVVSFEEDAQEDMVLETVNLVLSKASRSA